MSLVALALPQDLPRMKIMAEKSALSQSGDTPAVYVEPVPVSGKKDKKDKNKHKKRPATKTLVHSSATTSIPIALSSDVNSLIHSAPSSPEFLKPKRGRGGLKLRTRSKGANSDPEISSASVSPSPSPSPVSSPSRRPLFLFKFGSGGGKRKTGSREVLNGPKTPSSRPGSPNVVDRFGSGSSIEPEATPATTLPGERSTQCKLEERNSGGEIPTIYISHEQNGCSVELEEPRKMSQTSVGSTLNSANSGYCTLSAAGSGDEGGSFSDMDCPSPISPSSMTSSPGGSVPNIAHVSINTAASSAAAKKTSAYSRSSSVLSPDSEPDYPHSEDGRDAHSPVATPTTPLSAPLSMSVSPLPGPRGVSPPTECGLTKSPGRGRDPCKPKKGTWDKVRKFVQALSPFTLQFNKKKYAWVQLAGHEDSFRPGEKAGTIQKKSDVHESSALKALSTDILSPFVPEYIQTVTKEGQLYVEMADLLREFTDPAVMDIKMGVRTYLEDELEKARTKKVLRQDMYKKMIDIDPSEPTPEEHAQQAITKPRYMQWRETISSSSSLGFRIEGIKTSEGKALKDFKTTRQEDDVKSALRDFISENPCVKEPFLKRLHDIRSALEKSEFFHRHEVIGSSLLFVYDSTDMASVHLIDFGKTIPLPDGTSIDHRSTWEEGNHEDGYLWGLDNLIRLWSEIQPQEYHASPVKHRLAYGRSNSAMAL